MTLSTLDSFWDRESLICFSFELRVKLQQISAFASLMTTSDRNT